MSPRKLKTIEFKEPVEVADVMFRYGRLPEGLYWNTVDNEYIIGIYFDEKDENRLYTEIHNVLWFFGEFEEEE